MGNSSHSEYHVNKSDDGWKNPKWKSIENENPNVIHAMPTILLYARLKRMAIMREITRAICRVQNVPQ